MGIQNLATRGATTILSSWFNDIKSILCNDFVPRNVSGIATDRGGSLGTEDYKWENVRCQNLFVGDNEIDPDLISARNYAIKSAKASTNGYPTFLTASGGGGGLSALLDATPTTFEATINGTSVSVISDQTFSSLTAAPSSNNTCSTNTSFASANASKWVGEHGNDHIAITSVGSEITALNGTVAAFQRGAEIILATVNTSANRLEPIFRGWASTSRSVLASAQTITLLKLNTLLLKSDGVSKIASTYYPESVDVSPSPGTAGKVYYERSTGKYGYDDGVDIQYDYMVIGYAVCDSADCRWVQPAHIALTWDSENTVVLERTSTTALKILKGSRISVAGNLIEFRRECEITTAGNMDSGEAIAADTPFFVYVTPTGGVVLSTIAPRSMSAEIKGFYHPQKYFRCVAVAMTSAAASHFYMTPFLIEGPHHQNINATEVAADKTFDLPPSIFFVNKSFRIQLGVANTSQAQTTIRSYGGWENVGASTSGYIFLINAGDYVTLTARNKDSRGWEPSDSCTTYTLTATLDHLDASPVAAVYRFVKRWATGLGFQVSFCPVALVQTASKTNTTDPTLTSGFAIPTGFRPGSSVDLAYIVRLGTSMVFRDLIIGSDGTLTYELSVGSGGAVELHALPSTYFI